jgi:UDP-N-acetylglucosamine 2-epimerase (hydrolysing)
MSKSMFKKILFITGTRADFGKLKPLILAVNGSLFVTGMHTLQRYGYTVDEVVNKAGFTNSHIYYNQILGEPMDLVLANTINGLSRYVKEYQPDMIIVHGDRVETLAGAIVGSLNNILVGHIEGGELSGTIDESIRHAVSKLAHVHFVANASARMRLLRMGEHPGSIFVIGSPEIDIMLSALPSLEHVKRYYGIDFDKYAIGILHPVSSEYDTMKEMSNAFIEGLLGSALNYILIYPNNDRGSHFIFDAYKQLECNPNFKIFPSIRFEYFLTLLKNAQFIIGNSSCGIRQAPIYGIPTINIGTRQLGRSDIDSIINIEIEDIIDGVNVALETSMTPSFAFGKGDSARKFAMIINKLDIPIQKRFYEQ